MKEKCSNLKLLLGYCFQSAVQTLRSVQGKLHSFLEIEIFFSQLFFKMIISIFTNNNKYLSSLPSCLTSLHIKGAFIEIDGLTFLGIFPVMQGNIVMILLILLTIECELQSFTKFLFSGLKDNYRY